MHGYFIEYVAVFYFKESEQVLTGKPVNKLEALLLLGGETQS